ncbi:MFS transporter [Streptomyces sp. NBC_01727]|nr:MFS transporter [Streptomyces sp. NBC_01727]
MFGNPLSGWIMDRFHGVNGWQGWQWMFVLEAIPALVIGVATLFYLDDGVRSAKWLNDEEKAVVERAIAEDVAHRTVHGRVGDAFRDPKVWLMCLIYFCFVMGHYALTFWARGVRHVHLPRHRRSCPSSRLRSSRGEPMRSAWAPSAALRPHAPR